MLASLTRRSPIRPIRPTSSQSLYRTLLSAVSTKPFSLPQTIDDYFDWPKAFHSTKSFNFLISLALRHASFASVRRLLTAMRAESIPHNLETRKLHLRWLVRTGRWNDAWKLVLQTSGKHTGSTISAIDPIPLPLWLELFDSQKRGALRRWAVADCTADIPARYNASPSNIMDCPRNATAEDAENSTRRCRRLLPRPCKTSRAVELSRYRALVHLSPPLDPFHQVRILPRTVLIITQKMHQVGQSSLALSTALSYLRSLPPQLRRCDRRRVLDLVNFHVSAASPRQKPGLKQHFTQRRVLWKFLHTRTDLIPSSTTLFLLLKSLRHCRRSGTLAMQCLHLFEKRWGPHVQSRTVRRRVADLALKEGRLDIVAVMIRLERRYRACGDAFLRPTNISRRKPWRTLFSRQGTEDRRWRAIEDKYRRRLKFKSEP